ncbi:MAG: RDD family protein [Fibrobacterales bacterium]
MNKNNVPLLRRALTLFLEVSCRPEIIITLGICYLMSSHITSVGIGLIVLFITIPMYMFDQVVLPRKTGFTIIRYLFGFKIVNTIKDKKLGYFQLLYRSSLVLILESMATSLISLCIICFRDDNRSIHELLSKTSCVVSHKARYYVLVFVVPLMVFQYLALIQVGSSVVDNKIVKPRIEGQVFNYPQVINSEEEFVKRITGGALSTIVSFENTIESFNSIEAVGIEPPIEDYYGLFKPEEWTMLSYQKSMYCDSILFDENPYKLFHPMASSKAIVTRILASVSVSIIEKQNNYVYGCDRDTLYLSRELLPATKKYLIKEYEKYTSKEMISAIQVYDANGNIVKMKTSLTK